MKTFKDLNAVVAQLSAMAARGDVDSERKKHVVKALEELRRLRRKRRRTEADLYASVRRVSEELIRAFFGE